MRNVIHALLEMEQNALSAWSGVQNEVSAASEIKRRVDVLERETKARIIKMKEQSAIGVNETIERIRKEYQAKATKLEALYTTDQNTRVSQLVQSILHP